MPILGQLRASQKVIETGAAGFAEVVAAGPRSYRAAMEATYNGARRRERFLPEALSYVIRYV